MAPCHRLLLALLGTSSGLVACAGQVAGGAPRAATETPMTPPDELQPEIGTPPELDAPLSFNATMTGREQVPAVYATRATGTATFRLDAARTTLTYTVTHTLGAPTEAHVHLGLAGESGEVLLPLTVAPGTLTGEVAVSPAQARAIEEGRAYVDLHSADYPDGEIRGQVVLPGELVYVARLSADQENPPSESTGAGLGEFLVDGTTNRMRFLVNVRGMSTAPTVAVIGLGPAGVDGPMAVDLADPKTLPAPSFTGARSITSVEDLDLGRWYINVHSRHFPRGEVRGQILRPGQELYVGRMSGAEAVPPVSTRSRGSISVIVDSSRDRIIYDVALSDLTPTSAQLVEGAPEGTGARALPLEVRGSSFRAMRMLTPDSTLVASLAGGNAYVVAASAMFPRGEIRGRVRQVGMAR